MQNTTFFALRRDMCARTFYEVWSSSSDRYICLCVLQDYGMPQRRNRVFMVATPMSKPISAVELFATMRRDHFFTVEQLTEFPRETFQLIKRRKDVLRTEIIEKKKQIAKASGATLYVDLHSSTTRSESTVGVSTCVRPNSIIYNTKTKSALTPQDMLSLQGIWHADFPALRAYTDEEAVLVFSKT